MRARVTRLGVLVAIAALLSSCDSEDRVACLALPCAIPLALTIKVTAAGRPVTGALVEISGAITGSAQCDVRGDSTLCYVMGTAGRYDMKITAPGFKPAVRSASVEGTDPPCRCPTVVEQQLDVVLEAER